MHTQIMGVLNATPDSFYVASRFTIEGAITRALEMVEEGASIIDIGGESTRPGSDPISVKEELERVIPIIEGIVDKTKAKISVDTSKSEVAQKAIEAGATIVNDITGMKDSKMREIAADEKVEVVIMHMQGSPHTMQVHPQYRDLIGEIESFFIERIIDCENDGISSSHIILDPGIGFGKTTQHNIEILKNLDTFKKLEKRILIGASRKSFIGKILQNEEHPLAPEDRLEGSLAIASYCALKGIDILRVHDVKETLHAVKIAELLK